MSFEEMVVALVGSIAAFGFLGYVSAKIFGLIKVWINRNKGGVPEEEFNRLAKAFVQYKKDTERRLQNLETIISDENTESSQDSKTGKSSKQIEAPKENIEIKDQESDKGKSQTGNSNDLRNMLRE